MAIDHRQCERCERCNCQLETYTDVRQLVTSIIGALLSLFMTWVCGVMGGAVFCVATLVGFMWCAHLAIQATKLAFCPACYVDQELDHAD